MNTEFGGGPGLAATDAAGCGGDARGCSAAAPAATISPIADADSGGDGNAAADAFSAASAAATFTETGASAARVVA